jgi:transaldolase
MRPESAIDALRSHGQSIWLDNITRELLTTGTLRRYIDELGLTGLTSNPTIYDRTISGSGAYDAQIATATLAGTAPEELFFELALDDLRRAADLFVPIYDRTDGTDGFVSLEVSPLLAFNAAGTAAEAVRLWALADRQNLFIKIPGTPEGLGAVEEAIFAGVPVNVTLLFSPTQYVACAEAYTRGVERRIAAGLSARVPSVASLFISRWDAAAADLVPSAPRLQLGLAIGRTVWAASVAFFQTERWDRLRALGARPQRLLFASTGTKDPTASPTLYVEGLVARNTINTMPEPTFLALAMHTGGISPTSTDQTSSARTLTSFATIGIDVDRLGQELQGRGISAFIEAWASLTARLAKKARAPVNDST